MPFETPITIRDAIHRIQQREYLLPGIQREFVWQPEQICRLFDSLVRGYPIGSFLFWRVNEEHKADYQFYEFIRDYHAQGARHNPKANVLPAGGLTAVLDGQQRLTSLYLGLLGTHTERRKHARKNTAGSYAKRRLFLNLARPALNEEAFFDFRFLEADSNFVKDGDDFWFRVGDILSFKHTTDVFDFVIEHGLTQSKHPKTCLVELHRAITELPLINYFTEVEQDLDRVLNIFIRVNSGGTPLSYSDLLLSIASAQWEERDAREAIHALVDEINSEYGDFAFPRDFVLKSCLMLADVDLRWKVANFNRPNMQKIEALWPRIEQAIRLAVETISSFGFTGKTLASANAVIPIVYYLFERGNPHGFADSAAFKADRQVIQRWLNIVLLKRTFGGVPDNVLRRMREVIRANHASFPDAAIAADLEATPFGLSFRKGELEALLDGKYGGPYTFPLLAMFYPSLDFRHKLHQDHIHPRSHFTAAQLRKRGIADELHEQFMDRIDLIPNLQLLEGQPNIEKSATPFAEWLASRYPETDKRSDYLQRNFIPSDNYDLAHFLEFFEKRRAQLLTALRQLVGVDDSPDTESEERRPDEEAAGFHADCMAVVARHLGIPLSPDSQTLYASSDRETRAVCVVSKRYVRGQQGDRYWYRFNPPQVEFLRDAKRGLVVFGCAGADLTVVIPSDEFLPRLAGMRQTQEDGGRSYWHVELFGDSKRLELGQSLFNSRIDVTQFVMAS
jgi:hypothetical protein